MGAVDMTASHMDRRRNDLSGSDFMKQQADPRNIRYRVHGSYLVEMDLVHRHSMGMRFRLGNEPIHTLHIAFHLVRKIQM